MSFFMFDKVILKTGGREKFQGKTLRTDVENDLVSDASVSSNVAQLRRKAVLVMCDEDTEKEQDPVCRYSFVQRSVCGPLRVR